MISPVLHIVERRCYRARRLGRGVGDLESIETVLAVGERAAQQSTYEKNDEKRGDASFTIHDRVIGVELD